MTETAPAEMAPPAAPAAAKRSPKKKAAGRSKPAGPKLGEQIDKIVAGCRDRKGMSAVAIMKALTSSGVDVGKRRAQIRMCIKKRVESGSLVQTKGAGLSGSFKSGQGKSAVKTVKKANKPPAKKSSSNKSGAKKAAAKKPAANKAAAKKPAAKKAAAKKPAAKKAAAKKPAAKKAAAKKPAAKKAAVKKTAAKKAAPKPKKTAVKK
ncbi:histone H1-like [Mobula birostris]|uniref:histone H1-like n=1 Tax=Mobula birostris TaxID=1983395 RepID=UPI003B27EA12